MKKTIVAISVISAFALSANASSNTELIQQINDLKTQLSKLEKKVSSVDKKANTARMLANGNHLKWDVDFRTTLDSIKYTMGDGSEKKNSGLLANRLLLNLKYDAGDNVRFYGTLAFDKAFGHTLTTDTGTSSYFDWVVNENLHDTNLRVKEVYWLYSNDTFFDKPISWTASIGRRPSTDGLGINFREGDKRKSAIASIVNLEFDGASFRWNLDKVIPLEGSWIKFCLGRGLTSAKPRFSKVGDDYAKEENYANSNMAGVIFIPYDNGQYSLHTYYSKANGMIGYDTNASEGFKDFGKLELATVFFKAEGIGDGINDFLDDTIFFASYSQSKTSPNNGMKMLGTTESKTGHSYWIGLQMPGLIADDARWGVEYNHGSKYWRSMTYGEDTMIGSKIAARGDAKEIYWIKPLTKSLSMNLRYTKIDYDYTGSNGFFGVYGAPNAITASNAAKKATDFRVSFRYKF